MPPQIPVFALSQDEIWRELDQQKLEIYKLGLDRTAATPAWRGDETHPEGNDEMIGEWERPMFGMAIAVSVCVAALWVTPRGDRARHTAWIVAYLSLAGFDVLFDSVHWRGWVEVALDIVGTAVFGAALARFAQSKLGCDYGLGRTILISGAIAIAGHGIAWPMDGLSGDLVQSLAIVAASIWPMMDRRTPACIRKSLDCATIFAAQVLFAVWVFGADSIQRAGGIEEGVDLVLVVLIGVAALATELRIALKEKHELAEAEAHARRDLESTTSPAARHPGLRPGRDLQEGSRWALSAHQ